MFSLFTKTENGATQLRSSGHKCLDFFAEAGSARRMAKHSPESLLNLFKNALAEDTTKAMSIMFWLRAIKEGAGERRVFDVLLKLAYNNFPDFIKDNLALIGKLGYFKDYVRIAEQIPELEEAIVEIFSTEIAKGNHYACKWLPRRSKLSAAVRAKSGMKNAEFRRNIAKNSVTVEQLLCQSKLQEINYAHVPSKAFNNYRKLFISKDSTRFMAHLIEGKINTAAIYPHEIFDLYFNNRSNLLSVEDVALIIEAQWRQLPNFINSEMRFLPVLDTSQSMNGLPRAIAYPLAIYCAENQKGIFKDKIVTFSSQARYFDLSGCGTCMEKMKTLIQYCIVDSTNIASVFQLILESVTNGNCEANEVPNCVLILSDMQFDEGAEYKTTLMNSLKRKYDKAGIIFPAIIYWNLDATNTGIHANSKSNATFISGFNPRIMKSVFQGISYEETEEKCPDKMTIDPLAVMNKALEPISAQMDFHRLTQIPPNFALCDYNESRGISWRITEDIQHAWKQKKLF